MNSTSKSHLFGAALLLLCLFYRLRDVSAGGKGKGGRQGHIIIQNELKGHQVPVYMPIPIPIPMPMGPPPHGGGKHHHHQQQQHDDGEGEVKKIYLLQPMPKVQPQPNLKGGGFMGPVQTHIHLPSPMVNGGHSKMRHMPQQQRQVQHSIDGDSGHMSINQMQEHESYSRGGSKSSGGHGGSDLKILPIVVIPPIAPMPAIQMPQTSQVPPKMTLSPHFNNYIVAGSERRKSHSTTHSGSPYQDRQNFADYGGGFGASMFRDSYSRRSVRSDRGRHHPMGRSPINEHGSMTWSRARGRHDIDSNDDYDVGPSSWRQSEVPAPHIEFRRRDYRPSRRRMSPAHQDNSIRFNTKAIKDIIDSQITFDDEPISESSNEMRDTVAADRHADHLRNINRDQEFDKRNHHNRESSEDQRHGGETSRDNRDYNDQRYQDHHSATRSQDHQQVDSSLVDDHYNNERDLQSSPSPPATRSHQTSDLNPVYYDREYELPFEAPSRSHLRPTNRVSKLRYMNPHQERESFEDDEWRFDSIKSVTHSSPTTNRTILATANELTANSTNTITTIPPKL